MKPVRPLCLILLVWFLSHPAFSQNTKGDRPASQRDTRFRTTPKKEKKGLRIFSKKRLGGDRASENNRPRARARGGERAGKPIRPLFGTKKPKDTQTPWRGDLTGRRLRHKNSSSADGKQNVHPQRGPFVKRNPPDRQGRQNVARAQTVRVPPPSGRARNVYPQRGPYVNNPSSKPRSTERAISNREALARTKRLQSGGADARSASRARVVPRSGSRPFIRHKSINVYANFKRPKKKEARAQTTDLAGRRIRGRNYETPRRGVIPAPNIYHGRRGFGRDRAYKGPSGSYKSATRPGKAWTGDIAGRRIRHRDRSSKRSVEGVPVLAGRRRSVPRQARAGLPLPGLKHESRISGMPVRRRISGGFANQGEGFSGFMRARRPLKGGGSVSGKRWNNDGRPIPARTPRNGADIGGITVKRRLPGHGFLYQGEAYTGNIRARKPLKGGGSVSAKGWNNDGRPIPPRVPRNAADIGGITVKRRLPGHGFLYQGEAYSGNIKAKRKGPSPGAREAAAFRGRHKRFDLTPGFSDQGEEFTGFIRHSRFKRAYIQNMLANENSIRKARPEKEAYAVKGLQVKVKRRDYIRNKNAAEEALLKLRPTATDRAVAGLQVKVKQYNYIRNPSSSRDALKVREPGKAFARVTDYQGNIRMQKYKLFERNRELHPDAKFVRTNKNNVREERDTLTNFKLWWARLFKKQDTQPDHLKEKGKKPRYDKGEQGMWYD